MSRKLSEANSSIKRSMAVTDENGAFPYGTYRGFFKIGMFNKDDNEIFDIPQRYQIGRLDQPVDIQKEHYDNLEYSHDVERKFWKDDFSSDTSIDYDVFNATYLGGKVTVSNSQTIVKMLPGYTSFGGKMSFGQESYSRSVSIYFNDVDYVQFYHNGVDDIFYNVNGSGFIFHALSDEDGNDFFIDFDGLEFTLCIDGD